MDNYEIVSFIKKTFNYNEFIHLHYPAFIGNEKKYLNECIDTQFVSYVGKHVNDFEEHFKRFTGAKHAVAIANGTLALHISLLSAGVEREDEVITQAVSFVATANAIAYCGARPVFLDSSEQTLGMSSLKLEKFLENNTRCEDDGYTYNRNSGKRISACVPMHVYGHPVEIDKISTLCRKYNITLIEDCAESLGSFYKEKHTGRFGRAGIFSFNGNKVVTTGGGGMIITDDDTLAEKLKFLSTTAKVPHQWEFVHSEVGYNYRLPALNAAVGCAQMETLDLFLKNKRELADMYRKFFENQQVTFFDEPPYSCSNYWLNTILFKSAEEKDSFLEYSNCNGVMTRPMWRLLSKLEMYKDCETDGLETAKKLEEHLVNIPSSARMKSEFPWARY